MKKRLHARHHPPASPLDVKLHLWANANAGITVGIKIIIEGPEGTNPY